MYIHTQEDRVLLQENGKKCDKYNLQLCQFGECPLKIGNTEELPKSLNNTDH